ncbi:MAG: hypothetical protein WBP81_05405 [Solirubrobacteraceae bacterium]
MFAAAVIGASAIEQRASGLDRGKVGRFRGASGVVAACLDGQHDVEGSGLHQLADAGRVDLGLVGPA